MDPIRNDDDELVERLLDDLPLECLQLIVSYVNFRQWPQLELVNRRLRAGVLANWWMMKEAHLEEYCERQVMSGQMTRKEALQVLLRIIFTRSPHVRSIGGFSILKWPQYLTKFYEDMIQLDSEIMMQVATFPRLRSITFTDCEIRVKHLAIFLAESKSRAVLEELCIFGRNGEDVVTPDEEDDEMMRNALIDLDNRPPLRLKAFRLRWNRSFPRHFLAQLNASRLQVFSVIGHFFKIAELTELLSRCTRLEELRIDIFPFVIPNSPWISVLSTGLKMLPSRYLRRLGLFGWDHITTKSEAAEVLAQLADKYPKLEVLDLPCWPFLKDLAADGCTLKVFGKRFKMLEELHLNISKFAADPIAQLFGRMGQLKRLSLSDYDEVYDHCTRIVASVASNLKNLTRLHLDVRAISSDDATILLQMEKLKELSINFLEGSERSIPVCQQLAPILVTLYLNELKIGDQLLVSAIGKRVMGIRRLSLRCARITDVSLFAIANSCPLMEELDIVACNRITEAGVKCIIDKCKKLKRMKAYTGIADEERLLRGTPVEGDLYAWIVSNVYYNGKKWLNS